MFKNSVVCAKFSVGSKFHFSQKKTYFPNLLINSWDCKKWNIYHIHQGKFEMWPTLCKFPILFSTVKLKLGRNSQLICRFKIGTFESWSQAVFPSFSQFTERLTIGIFECCSGRTSQFLWMHGRDWKLGFL